MCSECEHDVIVNIILATVNECRRNWNDCDAFELCGTPKPIGEERKRDFEYMYECEYEQT